MLVKTIKSGDAMIYIHDDYCKDKTEEDVKAILDDIARVAYPALKAAYMKKMQEDGTA